MCEAAILEQTKTTTLAVGEMMRQASIEVAKSPMGYITDAQEWCKISGRDLCNTGNS